MDLLIPAACEISPSGDKQTVLPHLAQKRPGYSFICFDCAKTLIIKKESIDGKRRHFCHKSKTSCTGNGESSQHNAAKSLLAHEFQRFEFRLKCRECCDVIIRTRYALDEHTGKTEVSIMDGKYRIDAVLYRKGEMNAALEVFYKHRVPPDKAAYLRQNFVGYHEVDAQDVLQILKVDKKTGIMRLDNLEDKEPVPLSRLDKPDALCVTCRQRVWLREQRRLRWNIPTQNDDDTCYAWAGCGDCCCSGCSYEPSDDAHTGTEAQCDDSIWDEPEVDGQQTPDIVQEQSQQQALEELAQKRQEAAERKARQEAEAAQERKLQEEWEEAETLRLCKEAERQAAEQEAARKAAEDKLVKDAAIREACRAALGQTGTVVMQLCSSKKCYNHVYITDPVAQKQVVENCDAHTLAKWQCWLFKDWPLGRGSQECSKCSEGKKRKISSSENTPIKKQRV